MRIILTGGGTGGHIYPALAIGDKFKEMDPDSRFLYLGDPLGMERHIVPEHGYELRFVRSMYIDGKDIKSLAHMARLNITGIHQAYRMMKKFKPDIVMSTGSFGSLPAIMAGRMLGVKIFLHEQNAFPGKANKFFERYSDKVFLGFRSAADRFKDKSKLVYTGNPVRKEFYEADRKTARDKLGIPSGDKMILVFGGSLGASKMNEIGEEIVRQFGDKEGVSIVFGTGLSYHDEVTAELNADGYLDSHGNVHIVPYIEDMPDALAACDVVVSRAGALSVTEIAVVGRAAVFIPSANVTEDHQYYNAKAIQDCGGAVIVRENDKTVDGVIDALRKIVEEPGLIEQMQEGSRKAAPEDATEIIYREIMEDLKQRG